jgi:hypothetical protein
VFLPVPSGGGVVSYATPRGFAAGSVVNPTGVSTAARWSLAAALAGTPQPQLLSSAYLSYATGMNQAGDVAIGLTAPNGSGAGMAIVPVKGPAIVYPTAESSNGLSARDQTVAPLPTADGNGAFYLIGPSGRAKLPSDPNSSYACFDGVTDAGYLAYEHDYNGGDQYVYLRDPDGTIHRTGLSVSDCNSGALSDHGYLAGDVGEYDPAVYHAGTLTHLGAPAGATYPSGGLVNDEGEVIIGYVDAAGDPALALWRHGSWILLPVPEDGTVVANATSLDDTGQATGWYENGQGEVHAVLWKIPAAK